MGVKVWGENVKRKVEMPRRAREERQSRYEVGRKRGGESAQKMAQQQRRRPVTGAVPRIPTCICLFRHHLVPHTLTRPRPRVSRPPVWFLRSSVVELVGVGCDNEEAMDSLFVVLEYLPGGSLKKLMTDKMADWNVGLKCTGARVAVHGGMGSSYRGHGSKGLARGCPGRLLQGSGIQQGG
eukprot:41-Chlamydomonas_euryale.AAC.2